MGYEQNLKSPEFLIFKKGIDQSILPFVSGDIISDGTKTYIVKDGLTSYRDKGEVVLMLSIIGKNGIPPNDERKYKYKKYF